MNRTETVNSLTSEEASMLLVFIQDKYGASRKYEFDDFRFLKQDFIEFCLKEIKNIVKDEYKSIYESLCEKFKFKSQ